MANIWLTKYFSANISYAFKLFVEPFLETLSGYQRPPWKFTLENSTIGHRNTSLTPQPIPAQDVQHNKWTNLYFTQFTNLPILYLRIQHLIARLVGKMTLSQLHICVSRDRVLIRKVMHIFLKIHFKYITFHKIHGRPLDSKNWFHEKCVQSARISVCIPIPMKTKRIQKMYVYLPNTSKYLFHFMTFFYEKPIEWLFNILKGCAWQLVTSNVVKPSISGFRLYGNNTLWESNT